MVINISWINDNSKSPEKCATCSGAVGKPLLSQGLGLLVRKKRGTQSSTPLSSPGSSPVLSTSQQPTDTSTGLRFTKPFVGTVPRESRLSLEPPGAGMKQRREERDLESQWDGRFPIGPSRTSFPDILSEASLADGARRAALGSPAALPVTTRGVGGGGLTGKG